MSGGMEREGTETQPDPQRELAAVRDLAAEGSWHDARVHAERLLREPSTETAGRLCAGWLSHRRGWHEAAWAHFSGLETELLVTAVPVAAFESALLSSSGDRTVADDIAADPMRLMPAAAANLARRQLVRGEIASARALGARGLVAKSGQAREMAESVLEACRSAGQMEDRASASLIAVCHPEPALPRRPASDDSLDVLGALAHLPAQERTSEQTHVSHVSRELSWLHPTRDAVWAIVTGGPFRTQFGLGSPLPLPSTMPAIFVGFHCVDPRVLTADALRYLRLCQPIGCRDWASVDLLLGAGVEAFFSDSLASAAPLAARVPVGSGENVGRQARQPDAEFGRFSEEIGEATSFVRSCLVPGAVLRSNSLSRVVAAGCAGARIEFTPDSPADPRLDCPKGGGLDAAEARRPVVHEPLRRAMAAILDRKSADEVRRIWRDAVAGEVRHAVQRRAALPALPRAGQMSSWVTDVRRNEYAVGPGHSSNACHVAMAFDQNLLAQLPIALDSMIEHATTSLSLVLLTRGIGVADMESIASHFPTTHFRVLPCDAVNYGDVTRMIPHVTVSTMDRLLLPSLVPDIDRVAYLDVDALMLGDVSELAAFDLHGRPVAARSTESLAAEAIQRMALTMPPDVASEFRLRYCDLPLSEATFNAGVLVLDLAQMRRDGFVDLALSLVSRYGLHDQDVLLLYSAGRRAELSRQWNTWPLMEPVVESRVVHYLGPLKPWSNDVVPGDRWWRRAEQRWAAKPTASTSD